MSHPAPSPYTDRCFCLRLPVTDLTFQLEHSSLTRTFLYPACGFLPPISITVETERDEGVCLDSEVGFL